MIFTTGKALCAVVFSIRCMMDTRVRENINTMLEFIISFAFNLKKICTNRTIHCFHEDKMYRVQRVSS